MITEQEHGARLTTDGGVSIQLTVAGDAVYHGSPLDLTEAREVWARAGGASWEFDRAVYYVDSLR